MCPHCGTRATDWDDGGDGEDSYVASLHRCIGCQAIADKQKDIPEGEAGHGFKVHLVPAAVHAALAAQRELTRSRRRRTEDEDDE